MLLPPRKAAARQYCAEAVRLIDETMRPLYAESGQPEDFDSYAEGVRAGHKAKRNLMKLMAGLDPARAA